MKALFKDTALQEQFERQGYLTLPLLSADEIKQLLQVYDQYIRQEQVSGLYESSRNNAFEGNRAINNAIYQAMKAPVENICVPSQLYGGTFMVKAHKSSEVLPLHQDWSVVEEEQYSTIFIWCPLVDVSPSNGCLFVLEGSHRYFNNLRSGSYPSNRYVLPLELHQYTKDIPLKAGEAILYSDRLFHGSHANNGDQDRIVVTGRVMEAEASLVYFHKASEKAVDVYQADEAFYLTQIDRIAKGQKPLHIPKLYTRPYIHIPVTDMGLQTKIREHFPHPNHNATMNCQLFKDPALQEAFEKEGYVVIDLIDRQQVAALYDFYQGLENAPVPEYGFQVSLDNQSSVFVQEVAKKLISTVHPHVDRHFQDHQIFTASFVVKEKNPMGVVPPHQDWTFVDENRYWSATLWCPLVDVDMHNGGLGLIKGSHRFYDHVRPSPSPQYEPPFKDQLFSIFPYLNIIGLKAGQAIVFNNQTLHGSPPNTTDQSRISFGIGITHKEAKLRHYYLLPGQENPLIEGYEVQPDFFYSYNNARLSALYNKGEKPHDLNSIGLFTYTCKKYETDQLEEKIKVAGNGVDEALIQKMASLFGYNVDGSRDKGSAAQNTEVANTSDLPFWKVYTPRNIYRELHYRLTDKERPFWKVYTPVNILREISYRLTRK